MKRWIAIAAALAALAAPAVAAAHPLGNFTVNRYSRIAPSGDRVYVHYVLDLAEIPTLQAKDTVRSEGREQYARKTAAAIASNLELRVGGRLASLRPLRHALAFPSGAAGLETTRLEIVLATPPLSTAGPVRISYIDHNYANRIGWKEIIASRGKDASIVTASVPSSSISDGLLSYPKDLLESPADVTEADVRVRLGRGAGVAPALPDPKTLEQSATVRAVSDGGFAKLIAEEDLSVGFILLALAIAMFWGAAHGLGPGHGKSIVTAYLIGQRGTARHAAYLGGIVTVTHTVGVFGLGLVTLVLSQFIVPEQLYPWLNLVAGLMVLGVGLAVFRKRTGHRLAHLLGHDHHHHEHKDGHDGHSHAPPDELSLRSLVAVGASGGILPCPSALVVLLAAISLHRIGFGLVLIVFFSLGLALSITSIGLVAVLAKSAFGRMRADGPLVRLLPAASAFVILVAGAVMTARALPKVGI